MGPRVILHGDMDAFYASVEQRDRPELRGRPVIVGGSGPRGVVAAASYEARRCGVRSAMPGADARRRCPDGVFVAPRMDVYAAESRRVRRVFEEFTPVIEPLSLDEAFLDVTGSTALFGDGPTIAVKLRAAVRAVTGLNISVGVAPCKFAAKVASDLAKPDGMVVVPPDVAAFLAALPVSRLWGAGPQTQQRLRRAGWCTIGDLQRVDRAQLVQILGASAGGRFYDLARGRDPRPVEVGRVVKSISHETTFAIDLDDGEELHRVLFGLAEQVARRLRRRQMVGGVVCLKLRYGDFTTLTRQRTLSATTCDERELFAAGWELLNKEWDGSRGIRLVGLGLSHLMPVGVPAPPRQASLFDVSTEVRAPVAGDRRERARGELLAAMDRIRDRFGEGAIGHGGAGLPAGADSGHRP